MRGERPPHRRVVDVQVRVRRRASTPPATVDPGRGPPPAWPNAADRFTPSSGRCSTVPAVDTNHCCGDADSAIVGMIASSTTLPVPPATSHRPVPNAQRERHTRPPSFAAWINHRDPSVELRSSAHRPRPPHPRLMSPRPPRRRPATPPAPRPQPQARCAHRLLLAEPLHPAASASCRPIRSSHDFPHLLRPRATPPSATPDCPSASCSNARISANLAATTGKPPLRLECRCRPAR